MDNAIHFAITYQPDSDLSIGYRYPPLIQLGPIVEVSEAFYLTCADWKSEY